MTLRNRHHRTNDHTGTLDLADVDVDELPGYAARTPLSTVLAAIAVRRATAPVTTGSFTIAATFRRTMEWQAIPGSITIEAIIGTGVPSPQTSALFFRISADLRKTISGTRTVNAAIRRNQVGSFTADAVIV